MADKSTAAVLDPNITVTLGGKTYDLKPTFGALIRIERALGSGIGEIITRFPRGEYGASDTARIIHEGVVAAEGNGAPSYEEIGRLVVREGVNQIAPAAIELLSAALSGFSLFSSEREDDADAETPDDGTESVDPTRPQAGTDSPGAPSSAASSPSASNRASSTA